MKLRVFWRSLALIALTLFLVPFALGARAAGSKGIQAFIVRLFFRGARRLMGMRVRVNGQWPREAGGWFVVSNHVSYLDIFVLGGQKDFRFTPKREIEGWPIFGFLTGLSRPIYIDRNRQAAGVQAQSIASALDDGERVVLFAEGTTGGGMRMLPFRSSLFSPLETADVPIVPVSIAYTRLNGLPITHAEWPSLAWFGDMDLMPHLRDVLCFTRIDVTLVVHPPMRRETRTRKELAQDCHHIVSTGLHDLKRPPKGS